MDFDEMKATVKRATDPHDPITLIKEWTERLPKAFPITRLGDPTARMVGDLLIDLYEIADQIFILRTQLDEARAEIQRLNQHTRY